MAASAAAALAGIVIATASIRAAPASASDEVPARARVHSACSGSSERITYPESVTAPWRKELDGMISGKFSPARGFSNALSMRRAHSLNPELKAISEYWISRSLLEARMVHVAHAGFQLLAQAPYSPETFGIQLAALECLARIGRDHATLGIPRAVSAKLPQHLKHAEDQEQREIAWKAIGAHFRDLLGDERPKTEIIAALELLKGAGPHESLAWLAWSAKQADHTSTLAHGEKLLADSSMPSELKRFEDQAHLLLARSYYSTGDFKAAGRHLKLVQKKSNELAKALSELAWAYLMDEKYAESIGTAMNLQAGGLRHTFAPEAPMVMAMALNELCQFPESLKAVNTFRKHYEKPFRWLENWSKAASPDKTPLYKQAVAFLGRKGDVPDRIGSEWARSPLFLSHQGEINLLFDERDSSAKLGRAGAKDQRRLAMEIQDTWRRLKTRIRDERKRLKPGEALPQSTRDSITDLRYSISVYRRLIAAAPAWRTILASHLENAGSIESRLVKRINADLSSRTLAMYTQLQEISENNQLIEVEIYNGASQDIIWQNAHPEYKEIAKRMKEESSRASAEKVWDWGRAPAMSTEEAGEVWEDELGSFKAELYDNCSSKDKYLAIRRTKS